MFPSLTAFALLGTVTAHMQVQFPPPLKSKFNPNTPSADVDYNMVAPLEASGSDFPCKGYQTLLGSPAGAPTASFAIGSQANMTITGSSEGSSANHGGGSCQISLSTDGAKTFTVLKSIIGNCPTSGTSNLDFTIPADAPTGNQVLAWTWHNQIGNREMYMNCASVTLTPSSGGGNDVKKMARAAAYASRPGIFIANVGSAGGGCKTEETFDVVYPQPGPDVVNDSSKPKAPTCGVTQQVNTGGGGGGIFSPGSGAGADTGSNNQPTSAAASPTPAAQPATTLATSLKPANTPSPLPAIAPAPVPAPAPLGASDTGSTSGASSSGSDTTPSTTATTTTTTSSNSPGSKCTDEGAWACISNGSAFQRCASGQWSAIMQMAPGTSCALSTSGQFEGLVAAAI